MSSEPKSGEASNIDGIDHQTNGADTQGLKGADELIVGRDSEVTPTLSVIMPTLNEEAGIEECISRIRSAVESLGLSTEIIISDSSTDRTPNIAREMGAIVVQPDEPGYGYAYQYAFNKARGEYIAIGDADTTYDFEELPKLYRLVAKDDADMAMGSRLEGDIKPGAMPNLHQYVGNPLLTKFLNVFYDTGVSDAHSGMRVFSKDAWEEMECDTQGMEFASEMIMEAGARGLTIKEEPITYYPREGEATLESFRDGWRHVRFMLLNAPGYLFSVPGLVIGLAGMLLMSIAATELSFGSLSFGVRSAVAGGLMALVGYQVGQFGIFSAVATNPVRRPSDPITTVILDHISLERGALVGVAAFGIGAGYAGLAVSRWATIGYPALPSLVTDVAALVLIVLGIQTVFGSFFVSSIQKTK